MVLMPITDKKQNSLFLKSYVADIKISSGFLLPGEIFLEGIERNKQKFSGEISSPKSCALSTEPSRL